MLFLLELVVSYCDSHCLSSLKFILSFKKYILQNENICDKLCFLFLEL